MERLSKIIRKTHRFSSYSSATHLFGESFHGGPSWCAYSTVYVSNNMCYSVEMKWNILLSSFPYATRLKTKTTCTVCTICICYVARSCREGPILSALPLALRHLLSADLTFEFSHAFLLSSGFVSITAAGSSAVKLFARCPFHIPAILTGHVTSFIVLDPHVGIAPSFVLVHGLFIMLFRYRSSGLEMWLTSHRVIAVFLQVGDETC